MGLFDVQLSINYGEGAEKAFFRLQEEIMKRSCAMGLFAWNGEPSSYNSMLAEKPACFEQELDFPYNSLCEEDNAVRGLLSITCLRAKTDSGLSNPFR
jgi:hypothetical protein